ERDSITRAYFFNRSLSFIDSIMHLRPSSGVIPYYIDFNKNTLGRETVSDLYYRLPETLRNSMGGKVVLTYLQRSFLLHKGTTVENFTMPAADGSLFHLSSLKEKYILLDFWASWCGPCRAAHPSLIKNYEAFKDKGFTIVSISLDESRTDWLAAIKKDGLAWINISDLKGRNNSLAKRYRINPLPFNVLLDEHRRVVATNLYDQSLNQFLKEALKD
ncbi:MAG: TlpA disulfide reductase family protein, partial [Chitinophagaceae bacterium]